MERETLRNQACIQVAEQMLLRLETKPDGVRLLVDGVWRDLTWLELSDWCFDRMDELGMRVHLLPADAPDHWFVIAQCRDSDELFETAETTSEIDAVLAALAWGLSMCKNKSPVSDNSHERDYNGS